jgi:putative adhesin
VTTLSASPPATPAAGAADALPLTLGRRLTLAFGVPVMVGTILLAGFNLVGNVGRASFPVSHRLAMSDGHFTMNVGGGDVGLRGVPADLGTALLTGTVNYSLVRPKIFWNDGAGTAGVRLGCPFWSMTNCQLNAHVDLPVAAVVNASTAGGNVTAAGLSGAVTLSTGGGDVHASDLSGPLSVTTSGGNVSVDRIFGVTSVHTGGGDITGTGIEARDVTAVTSGGNIGLTLTVVPANLDIQSGGGDITIIVPRRPGGGGYDLTATTGGGDVNRDVNIDQSSPYKITATTSGGNITVEYPAS